jgi:hypothetical protein
MAPFWIFIYSLMIFLPAFSFCQDNDVRSPRWYHYSGAIVGCLLASAAVAVVVNLLSAHLSRFGSTLTFPRKG